MIKPKQSGKFCYYQHIPLKWHVALGAFALTWGKRVVYLYFSKRKKKVKIKTNKDTTRHMHEQDRHSFAPA